MQRTITLKTGKVIVTKEMNAFARFKMTSFITGTVNVESAQQGEVSAAYMEQSNMLTALFSIAEIDGVKFQMPTDQKTLALAFSKFANAAEFQDYVTQFTEDADPEGNSSTTGEDNNG